MGVQEKYEILAGEGLKTVAENALHMLGSSVLGREVAERYAFGLGGAEEDAGLQVDVAGISFANPVLFGAGWDKKGRAVHGLHALGFAGGEVGTVLPFAQVGNPRPRLWTIDADHSVGLNRLGFNSPGMDRVEAYLAAAQPLPCPIGINVGRNKVLPNELANWAHQTVIKQLGRYASYITLGISSPNTQGLRGLQDKGPFRDLLQGAQQAISETGKHLPLFVKIDAERTEAELDDMIEVGLEEGLSGFVATNTYSKPDLKAQYGARWGEEAGGLSGADPTYRRLATETVRHIYKQAGDHLDIIGAGGVDSPEAALEKIMAGASAVQVVTAIRPSKGKVAANITRGLSDFLDKNGIASIRELIGADTLRW